jgi:hypothetical protein
VFIGNNLFGTLDNPEQGKWAVLRNRVEGSFIKIQAAPNKYLHFCGLKIWIAEPIVEEPPEPEPIPEPQPPTGGIYIDNEPDKTSPLDIQCGKPQAIKLEAN